MVVKVRETINFIDSLLSEGHEASPPAEIVLACACLARSGKGRLRNDSDSTRISLHNREPMQLGRC